MGERVREVAGPVTDAKEVGVGNPAEETFHRWTHYDSTSTSRAVNPLQIGQKPMAMI